MIRWTGIDSLCVARHWLRSRTARGRAVVIISMALSFCTGMVQAWAAGSLHTIELNGVEVEYFAPKPLVPKLSVDGKTLMAAVPARVYIADPVEPIVPVRIPSRVTAPTLSALAEPMEAASSFEVAYVPDGDSDPWGQVCVEFPAAAKTAFDAAVVIWTDIVSSPVPITISAGWADLGSSSTLGYSGGGTLHRDFSGAPLGSTYYGAALANSLAGRDLERSSVDMHITYNKNFAWYYGTDGNTPSGQYDLMSVVLHEIAHGLNFSGSMSYSSGVGSYGYGTSYPNVYDRLTRDGSGIALTATGTYPNPSTALGSALTSASVWFHGPNAMAANGGQRVKLYAPSTWNGGSSYSHLDYLTFAGTANRLMVYAITAATSTHDPGPVSEGLFEDLGWIIAGTAPTITSSGSLPPGTVGVAYSQTLTAVEGDAPYSWSISVGSLPSGLSLSSGGVISGAPLAVANASFTVQVTGNDALSSTKGFSLAIHTAITVTPATVVYGR
jgi:hypothetical protein